MSLKQNKNLARRFMEISGANDQANLKELLAKDFVAHQTYTTQNREEFLQHLYSFSEAFSGSHFAMEEQIAEGDKVMTRATWHVTHSGEFQGLPPTGKQIAISAVLIQRIREGKIVEHWGLFDQLTMMQQLGAVPEPEQA